MEDDALIKSNVFLDNLYGVSDDEMSRPSMQSFLQYSRIDNDISSRPQYFGINNDAPPRPQYSGIDNSAIIKNNVFLDDLYTMSDNEMPGPSIQSFPQYFGIDNDAPSGPQNFGINNSAHVEHM